MVATRRKRYGAGGRRDEYGRWSAIDPELLGLIVQRLTIRDSVRCGAVCKSWRSVMLEGQYWSPATEPPWLVLRKNGTLYRFSERRKNIQKMNKAHHPRLLSGRPFGSSNGWVGLQRREKVHLFHPLKGTVLPLPSLITIPGVIAIRRNKNNRAMITGFVFPTGERVDFHRHATSIGMPSLYDIFLVPAPSRTATTEFRGVVLAICPPLRRLVFVVDGGSAWSLVDMPAPLCDDVDNVISYRGSVCAVDVRGRVAAWDGRNGDVPQFTRVIISSGPPEEQMGDQVIPGGVVIKRYLVEANGELLQVLRYMDAIFYRTIKVCVFRLLQREGEEEQEQEDEEKRRGKDSITAGTTGACKEEKKKKNYYYWAAVPSLGDLSLFLGFNSPAAFSSQDFPWLEKNCIYFTNQYLPHIEMMVRRPYVDKVYYQVRVYELSTGTERAIEELVGQRILAGFWFIPML